MTIPRINPMTTGTVTLSIVGADDQPIIDAVVMGDVYAPNGTILANDTLFTHFSGGIYTLEISPDWSAVSGDNGPLAVEGRYEILATITTPAGLRETERVVWIAAYERED